MKRIFIEGTALVDGHFSGVGQYILGVLRGIDEELDNLILSGNNIPKIKIIIPKDTVNKFRSFNFKHLTPKVIPLNHRYVSSLWHKKLLPPIDIYCGKGDYVFPKFVDMPLLFSKSKIVTVFDLSFELYKQYSEVKNAKFLSSRVGAAVDRAQNIVTISENAKKEIIDFYKVPEDRVKVATPAVDQKYLYRRSKREIMSVKQKYSINTDHYILALSNLEPRKNLEALVDAYCKLPEKLRMDTALLLVGVNGWKADKLFDKIINKSKQGFKIIRPNKYVTDADKPAIISGASMLVYPSHYEGFGMPPLEALACGVPVITANNSSLPEVVKGVGKMVPSNNKRVLLEAMIEYLENIEFYTKQSIQKGPERAQQFSWSKSGKVYLNLVLDSEKIV